MPKSPTPPEAITLERIGQLFKVALSGGPPIGAVTIERIEHAYPVRDQG